VLLARFGAQDVRAYDQVAERSISSAHRGQLDSRK
jgi:hypothetical protein